MIRPLKIKCFRPPLVRPPRALHAIIFAHVVYQLHELLFAHIQCFRHGDGVILEQEFRCDRFECRFTVSFVHRVASLVFPIPFGPCATHQGNLPYSMKAIFPQRSAGAAWTVNESSCFLIYAYPPFSVVKHNNCCLVLGPVIG